MNFVDEIADKVRQLPLEKQIEVRDFVDFLIERALRDARRLQSLSTTTLSTQEPVASLPVAPENSTTPVIPQTVVEVNPVESKRPVHPSVLSPVSPPPAQVLQSLPSTNSPAFSMLTEADKAAVGESDIEEAVGEMENFWSSWDDS